MANFSEVYCHYVLLLTWFLLQKMDPQMRKLLEVSYEAWVDSGVDPKELRGDPKVMPMASSSNSSFLTRVTNGT